MDCESLKSGALVAKHGQMIVRTKFVDRWTLPDASVVTVTLTGSPLNVDSTVRGVESAFAENVYTLGPSVYCASSSNSPMPFAMGPLNVASKLIPAESVSGAVSAEQPPEHVQSSKWDALARTSNTVPSELVTAPMVSDKGCTNAPAEFAPDDTEALTAPLSSMGLVPPMTACADEVACALVADPATSSTSREHVVSENRTRF